MTDLREVDPPRLLLAVAPVLADAANAYLRNRAAVHLQAKVPQDDLAGVPALIAPDSYDLNRQNDIFFESLRFELRALGRLLEDLYNQGKSVDQHMQRFKKVAKKLNASLSAQEVDNIIGKVSADTNVSLPAFLDSHAPQEQSNKELELRKLWSCVLNFPPEARQCYTDNPRIFRGDFSREKQEKLIRTLKKCNDSMNATSSSQDRAPDESSFRDFDVEAFKIVKERVRRLHSLLHTNWPCRCGGGHIGTLQALCESARLCLEAVWDMKGPRLVAFDVLLHGKEDIQECKICVDPQGQDEDCMDQVCQIEPDPTVCLDLIVDSSDILRDRYSAGAIEASNTVIRKETTLKQLIEDYGELDLREKRTLGVILANSLLHLYDSDWLDDAWGMEQISFFWSLQGHEDVVNLRKPYLSTRFGKNESIARRPQASRHSLHRFPGLLGLGIVLMELELGDRLAKVYERPEFQIYLQKPNANTRVLLAKELLKEYQKHREHNALGIQSIKKCLDCSAFAPFNNCTNPYDNDDFLKMVYTDIIHPLERELLAGYGVSITTEELERVLTDSPTDPICDPTRKPARGDTRTSASLIRSSNLSSLSQPLSTIREIPRIEIQSPTYVTMSRNPCQVFDTGEIQSVPTEMIEWEKIWFDKLRRVHDLLLLDSGRKIPFKRKDRDNMVRIAVLDTGCDITHPEFQRYIDAGQLPDSKDFIVEGEPITDEIGHGTHVAHLLFKTAPLAKVFPARVFKTTNADERTPSLVAQAIYHAVDTWEVDIISMSFAFPEIDPEIQEAIEHAAGKKVLMFSAASNNRANEENPIGYPARVRDYVICVNSSTGQDKQSSFSPNGATWRDNFSALGEGLQAAWPASPDGLSRQKGTSCATPLAAGIAALVLDYSRQKSFPEIKNKENLKRLAGMRKVMFEYMTDRNTNGTYNYLRPWSLLSGDPVDISSRISTALRNMYK